MENRFDSKIDSWLLVVIIAAGGISIMAAAPAFYQGMWWIAVPLIAIFGFVIWVFRSTYYIVDPNEVIVRSGPFRWRVPIAEIEGIKPTHNPLSSPALSLDRLSISYSCGRQIMISPKDKEGFLSAIEQFRG